MMIEDSYLLQTHYIIITTAQKNSNLSLKIKFQNIKNHTKKFHLKETESRPSTRYCYNLHIVLLQPMSPAQIIQSYYEETNYKI